MTPPYDLDYGHLMSSLQQLRETEIHANNRAKLKKNIDKVLAIQNSVSGVVRTALRPAAPSPRRSPTWRSRIVVLSMRASFSS